MGRDSWELVERNADPLIRDCKGKLPIDRAREKGHSEVIVLLSSVSQGERKQTSAGARGWGFY